MACVGMYFLDGAGGVISGFYGPNAGGSISGAISTMQRNFVKAQAPAGTVRVVFRMYTSSNPNTGAYYYRPQLEECLPNQTGPGPWGSGMNTIIGPGNISTGSLSAITANLGAITAGSLNINNNFIVAADGTCLIRSAASGQRTEIDQNGGRTYYSNGNLAVRWGMW
jgi:hypothetical protein